MNCNIIYTKPITQPFTCIPIAKPLSKMDEFMNKWHYCMYFFVGIRSLDHKNVYVLQNINMTNLSNLMIYIFQPFFLDYIGNEEEGNVEPFEDLGRKKKMVWNDQGFKMVFTLKTIHSHFWVGIMNVWNPKGLCGNDNCHS